VKPEPLVPDFDDRCIANLLQSLAAPSTASGALNDLRGAVAGARCVVLLIVDGLGALQLAERSSIAPTLSASLLEPITSVAPSTTAAALTSISTGVAPGRHGLVGYRMEVDGEILQSLRWTVAGADASSRIAPERIQRVSPLLSRGGRPVPYVGRSSFASSAFTKAHLRGSRYVGADDDEAVVASVARESAAEPFVLAYHDAVDKTAHVDGLGERFDAEVARADGLVASLREALPADVAIVVTADHGQVDVGSASATLSHTAMALVDHMSGEGRFRWLHAHPGEAGRLAERAHDELDESCWVFSRRQLLSAGIFGEVDDEVADRLGDVALVPFAPLFVPDPAEPHEVQMKGRHGSLTEAEMMVPLAVC